MKEGRTTRVLVLCVCSVSVLFGCTGCQTFSLTKEEWEMQQSGQMVDRYVGAAVGILGSVGYCGALVGAAVAEAVKK